MNLGVVDESRPKTLFPSPLSSGRQIRRLPRQPRTEKLTRLATRMLEKCSDSETLLGPQEGEGMNRSILFGALTAIAAVMTASRSCRRPSSWPWKSKTPPDPALVPLVSSRATSRRHQQSDPPIVTITVNATAPTPDYTELQLTPRMGDPKDLIFAFDAKGRRPRNDDPGHDPGHLHGEYSDAPDRQGRRDRGLRPDELQGVLRDR